MYILFILINRTSRKTSSSSRKTPRCNIDT